MVAEGMLYFYPAGRQALPQGHRENALLGLVLSFQHVLLTLE